MNSREVWRPGGDKAIYAIETFHSIDAFVTGAQTMSESTRVATGNAGIVGARSTDYAGSHRHLLCQHPTLAPWHTAVPLRARPGPAEGTL